MELLEMSTLVQGFHQILDKTESKLCFDNTKQPKVPDLLVLLLDFSSIKNAVNV